MSGSSSMADLANVDYRLMEKPAGSLNEAMKFYYFLLAI